MQVIAARVTNASRHALPSNRAWAIKRIGSVLIRSDTQTGKNVAKKKSLEADADIRELILEAAKERFVALGLEKTSVRAIGDRANVNSAMLGYYFGSKEALFREIVGSIAGSLSVFRLRELTMLRDQQAGPIPLKCIFRAYAEPILLQDHPLQRDAQVYLRLVGRLYAEPSDPLAAFIQAQFTDVQRTYISEIARTAPYLDTSAIAFRFSMMVGAMTFLGARMDVIELLSGPGAHPDSENVLDRFASDWATMMSAPSQAPSAGVDAEHTRTFTPV